MSALTRAQIFIIPHSTNPTINQIYSLKIPNILKIIILSHVLRPKLFKILTISSLGLSYTESISFGTKSAICSSHSSIMALRASSSGSSSILLSSVISSTSDGVISLSFSFLYLLCLCALTNNPPEGTGTTVWIDSRQSVSRRRRRGRDFPLTILSLRFSFFSTTPPLIFSKFTLTIF